MSERVFGLTANEVMAYAAMVSALLAVVLAAITAYYAWYARCQADASKEQVAAANRQADAAQRTLDLLLKEKEQQRRNNIATTSFQLAAALHMVDDWRGRIEKESFDLPDVIEMRPTNFNTAVATAERIDQVVSGYIGAALLYIAKAETDVRIMRDKDFSQSVDSPLAFAKTSESRERLRARAGGNLDVARFKLDRAQIRLAEVTPHEERLPIPNDESKAVSQIE